MIRAPGAISWIVGRSGSVLRVKISTGHAGLGDVDGQVANIDVHPTGILAAESRERAGVHGDHRYPAEQQWVV